MENASRGCPSCRTEAGSSATIPRGYNTLTCAPRPHGRARIEETTGPRRKDSRETRATARRLTKPTPLWRERLTGLSTRRVRLAHRQAAAQRERERERDASATLTRPIKDPSLLHRLPITLFPNETTLRTAPSLLRPGSSPESTSKSACNRSAQNLILCTPTLYLDQD